MERLAAGAAHKRKGGALEQLGGASGGRRSGHASAAEATAAAAVAEAAAAAGAEAQQGELTDRSEMHLLNLRETQRELTNQIDAITGEPPAPEGGSAAGAGGSVQGCRCGPQGHAGAATASPSAHLTAGCYRTESAQVVPTYWATCRHPPPTCPHDLPLPPVPSSPPSAPPPPAAAGLQVLDNVRASFLERMARVKGEVGDLLAQTEGMLRTESTATLVGGRRAPVW
mgnify:CR=1 FL=1